MIAGPGLGYVKFKFRDKIDLAVAKISSPFIHLISHNLSRILIDTTTNSP